MSEKYEEGTVGRAIEDLVALRGNSRMGVFILEMALKEVCGMRDSYTVSIEGVPISRTPGYKRIGESEDAILAHSKINIK